MSRQFRHKYIQSKVGKSMFDFIRQISYVSKIHFLFDQSYGFYFDLIGHIKFEVLIRFNFNILRLQIEVYHYVFTIIRLLKFESAF